MGNVFQVEVELSGPFFTKNPGRTVRQNIRDFEEAIAAEGERRVKAAIAGQSGRMPAYTGHTYARIVGRTRAEIRRGGKYWSTTAVVSANTDGMSKAEAIRTKAAASTIEARWHPFRRTAYALRALVKKLDLTKGLAA